MIGIVEIVGASWSEPRCRGVGGPKSTIVIRQWRWSRIPISQRRKPMTRTAKAAIYTAPNEPFVVKDYPLRPVAVGEVLVRVRMSTICRSDIHSYEGKRPNPCPGILGHEIIDRKSTRLNSSH